jgi:hypothetical protein
MITVLLLIFDPSGTWEKIGTFPRQNIARIFLTYLLPLLILSIAVESLGLMKLGMWEGEFSPRLVKPSQELVIRYQTAQLILDLFIIFVGSWLFQSMAQGFHRHHTYSESFATLAYSLGPLYMARMLDGIPAMNTWICYGIGVLLSIAALYRGIPRVMKPDPSNALGLYLMASLCLLVISGLAHLLAVWVLEQKVLVHGFHFSATL